MEVSFELLTPSGAFTEADLATRFDEVRPWLRTTAAMNGILMLYNSTGSFEVTALCDMLDILIPAVCWEAVQELAAGRFRIIVVRPAAAP